MAVKNIFVEGPIEPKTIAQSIAGHASKTNIGAHAIFLGQVRSDELKSGTVQAIEYSTYKTMALQKAHEIREEIFALFPISCMHIYHSLGRVAAGEISLFVFVSAPHRKEANQACNLAVEKIKEDLPVWGREITDHNTAVWKINR